MVAADLLTYAGEQRDVGTRVACRTAIIHAYYAAYHHAVDVLGLEGVFLPATGDAHEVICYKLTESNCPDLYAAGGTLRTLRTKRNDASYNLTDGIADSKEAATLAIKEAERVVNRLNSFRGKDELYRGGHRGKLKSDYPPPRRW